MTYRFGRFVVDSGTRQLLANGREMHLSPKAFELLLMLVDQRSRALSKTELQDALWPSTFVGETNLATLVAEIRRALGDSAQAPSYLRTVHRFGYRFVADVTASAHAPPPSHRVHRYLVAGERQFSLRDGAVIIGRAADADVRIDSSGVSRHHARITMTASEARVEDLESKNGTFVDGTPVGAGRLLADGSEIRVGPVALIFRIAPATEATETML